MPSFRSLLLRGGLVLALLGLAACGGGSSDDDSPGDQAKDACDRYGKVIAERINAGEVLSREQAQDLLEKLQGIRRDFADATSEDSAYFVLQNEVDQLLDGLRTANAALVNASQAELARECLKLFPDLAPQTTTVPTTTAPTTTAATEP